MEVGMVTPHYSSHGLSVIPRKGKGRHLKGLDGGRLLKDAGKTLLAQVAMFRRRRIGIEETNSMDLEFLRTPSSFDLSRYQETSTRIMAGLTLTQDLTEE